MSKNEKNSWPKIGLLGILLLTVSFSLAQNTVTGLVVSSNDNMALPGANVVIKGTNNGTVTDFDGNFTINATTTDVLVFSYIGYSPREIQVGNKKVINVTLTASNELDKVVVVGYGTTRKGDLTGSIATVSTKDFDKVPAASPLQILQGRAAGLSITNNSGIPGQSSDVTIRGTGSINGNTSPIYVVDGVIRTGIDNLNPNSIASVSVLKDASAAAIYGSRAANGVIIVTTKRGKGKGKPEITFNSYYGIQSEGNLKLKLLNAEQFVTLWTETHENAGLDLPWTQDDLDQYQGIDTDWKDLMLQSGTIANYDLSVAGGNEKSNYFISGNYLDQKGIAINTTFEKLNLTVNSDHKINDRVKFGNSIILYSSKRNGSPDHYQLALRKVPLTRHLEDDGTFGRIRNGVLEHIHRNPVWESQNFTTERKIKGVQGNLYLTISPLKGLDITARGSMDYENRYDTRFQPAVPDPAIFGWEGTTTNLVEKEYIETVHWIADFLANYTITIGENHNINALLGYSLEEQEQENLSGSRTGTPNNDIRFLDAGDPTSQLNGNGFTDWSFVSTFGRLNYNYKNRYFLNATVRRDGTSRLQDGNRYGVFPSAAIGWRISEENFFNNDGFINNLKFRASIGTLGNILSIGEYATIATLFPRGTVLDQVVQTGFAPRLAVNSDLVWEESEKKNVGLDASLVNNKIYMSLDYFVEDTRDLLIGEAIPISAGFAGAPIINTPTVRNSGFEVVLGIKGNISDWSYDVNFNLATVKNEVTDLGGRDLLSSGLLVGKPVNSFFGYKTNGLIREESQLTKYADGPFSTKTIGDIDIIDIDGFDADGNLTGIPDGIINAADRTIIGDVFPDFTYGMVGSVNYKNWGLQVQLQGVSGRDIYFGGTNSNDVMVLMSSWARNEDARVLRRFHPVNNPNGTWPRLSKDESGSNLAVSDFWLTDASYLRINNINLSYRLPSEVLEDIGLSNLSLFFSVQNAHTFTKYDGPSVDTNAGNPGNLNGSNNNPFDRRTGALAGVPIPRTFTLGVTTSF